MENELFKDVELGDKFTRRDGKPAVFLRKDRLSGCYVMYANISDDESIEYNVDKNGNQRSFLKIDDSGDIISKYVKPVEQKIMEPAETTTVITQGGRIINQARGGAYINNISGDNITLNIN